MTSNREDGKSLALNGVTGFGKKSVSSSSSSSFSLKGLNGIFSLILLALFFINVMRVASGQEDYFTFDRLFNAMQTAPVIDLKWLAVFDVFDELIIVDWGVLDFIRVFLNDFFGFFGDLLTLLSFVGTGAVQLILYVVHFIPVLFGY